MKNKFLKCFLCLTLALSMTVTMAQQPAEVMPLADESLVLSITKVAQSLIMVGERGHILKSEDNGKTWRQIENVPVNIALTKVVSSGEHVWAVGHDATIIHSSDGGENWVLQFYDPEREVPFLSALFVDQNRGYVIGAYGTLMTTDDGGENWNDDLINEELDYHLNDITQDADGNLFIAAEAGYFFRSLDQGETWEAIELSYMGSMFGVINLQDQVVLYGLRGHVLISEDQGENWQEIQAKIPNNLFGSTPLSNNRALLVGANGARLIYQNNSLEQLSAADSGDDYSDAFLLGQQVILVGETGFKVQTLDK